jgi:hypothetical protein
VTPTTADWQALQAAVAGRVVLPGAPDYESARKPVMARFANLRPAAVVRCATPADVAATIALARRAAPAGGDPQRRAFGRRPVLDRPGSSWT